MVITYYGKSLVKFQVGDLTVATNPFERNEQGKQTRFGADIVLVSCADEDHSYIDAVTYGSKIPFVVDSAGEYEIGGTYISGFLTDTISVKKDKKFPTGKKLNTSYCVFLENINICVLGAQKDPNIDGKIIEKMGEVDILVVPIGANGTLNAKDAYTLVKRLDPKIIIPVSYGKSSESKGELSEFLKEFGSSKVSKEEKLVLKRKDLENKNEDIFILNKN